MGREWRWGVEGRTSRSKKKKEVWEKKKLEMMA